MAKYKVLKEFILNGIIQKENSVIDLNYQQEQLKSIRSNVEKLADNDPLVLATQKKSSELDNLKPGEQLTAEQKEKLTKENVAETATAQQLAAEHRARDIAEGREKPVVNIVADTLKEKLANEEFEKKEMETLIEKKDVDMI